MKGNRNWSKLKVIFKVLPSWLVIFWKQKASHYFFRFPEYEEYNEVFYVEWYVKKSIIIVITFVVRASYLKELFTVNHSTH